MRFVARGKRCRAGKLDELRRFGTIRRCCGIKEAWTRRIPRTACPCIPLVHLAPVVRGCDEADGAATGKLRAADFSQALFDGGDFRPGDRKASPVIVSFVASWCTVRGSEASGLEDVHRQYEPQRAVFIGVAIKDTESKARDCAKSERVGLRHRSRRGRIDQAGLWRIRAAHYLHHRSRRALRPSPCGCDHRRFALA